MSPSKIHHLIDALLTNSYLESTSPAQFLKLPVGHSEVGVAIVVDVMDIDAVFIAHLEPARHVAPHKTLGPRPDVTQRGSRQQSLCHGNQEVEGGKTLGPALRQGNDGNIFYFVAERRGRHTVVAT